MAVPDGAEKAMAAVDRGVSKRGLLLGRSLPNSLSQMCLCPRPDNPGAPPVQLNYDTFGDKRKPAILLIMGVGAQKVRYPIEFCRRLAAQGHFVVRFDNRDAGRSDRFHSSVLQRILGLWTFPAYCVRIGFRQRGFKRVTFIYLVLGWLAWRRGRKRWSLLHLLVGFLLSSVWYRPPVPYTLKDSAQDCIRLLDKLGILRAHVVGYSMGGMIAQVFGRLHPHRTASLVLLGTCSPSAALSLNPGIPFLVKHTLVAGRAFDPLATKDQRMIGLQAFWRNISAPGAQKKQDPILNQELTRGAMDVDAMLRQVMAIMDFFENPFTEEERKCMPKALVIHGLEDPLIPYCYGIELARQLECQRCVILPGIAHDLTTTASDEILEAIQAHLNEVEGPPQASPATYLNGSTTSQYLPDPSSSSMTVKIEHEFLRSSSDQDLLQKGSIKRCISWADLKKSPSAAILTLNSKP